MDIINANGCKRNLQFLILQNSPTNVTRKYTKMQKKSNVVHKNGITELFNNNVN